MKLLCVMTWSISFLLKVREQAHKAAIHPSTHTNDARLALRRRRPGRPAAPCLRCVVRSRTRAATSHARRSDAPSHVPRRRCRPCVPRSQTHGCAPPGRIGVGSSCFPRAVGITGLVACGRQRLDARGTLRAIMSQGRPVRGTHPVPPCGSSSIARSSVGTSVKSYWIS